MPRDLLPPDAPAPLRRALETADSDRERAAALLALARHYREQRLSSAQRLAQAALELSLPLDDPEAVVDALVVLASVEQGRAQHEQAAERLALALDLAQDYGRDDLRPRIHNARGALRDTAGDTAGARRELQQTLALAHQSGNAPDLARAHVNLAYLELQAGNLDSALHQLSLFEEVLGKLPPAEHATLLPYLHENRAAAYLEMARRERARERQGAEQGARKRAWDAVNATRAALQRQPSRILSMITEGHAARLCVLEGRLDEALELARTSLRHHREVGQLTYLDALLAMAEVQAALGDHPRSERYYREALSVTRGQGRHRETQDLLRALADLHEARGELAQALRTTREALGEAEAALARLTVIEQRHDELFQELRQARNEAHTWLEGLRHAEEQARHDPLTGLLNRRGLHAALQELEDGPLLLVLVDVDHFKDVNDRHSHAVGDRALQAVGERLSAAAPPHTLLSRWGGEEFLLVVPLPPPAGPGPEPESGPRAAEALRRAVAAQDWQGLPAELRLTVSVGHAQAPGNSDAEFQAALERADEFLYHAKHGGRNRVYPPPATAGAPCPC